MFFIKLVNDDDDNGDDNIIMEIYIFGPNMRQRTTVALTVTHMHRLDNCTLTRLMMIVMKFNIS